MHPTRRALLGVAGTAFASGLAGCTDAGGGGATPAPTDAPTPTDTATPTEGGGGMATATVRVRSHPDLGEVLVGPDGLTLYMFDSDTEGAGASTCADGCAENWPPLTVESEPTAGDGVTATLTTFEREDGSTQVAAAGWPLYYFTPDEEPGDVNGQGIGDVWWVLRPDGTPVRSAASPTPTAMRTRTDAGGSGAGGY